MTQHSYSVSPGKELWPKMSEAEIEAFDEESMQNRSPQTASSAPLTREIIEEIIDAKLSSIRVYVLESDITEAQNKIKSVVELSSF